MQRMNRGEEALEIWQQILTGRLQVDRKATTVGDGVTEMLQLLLSVADEDARPPETSPRAAAEEAKEKRKADIGEGKAKVSVRGSRRRTEELFRSYAPCILRADPRTALPLLLRPGGGEADVGQAASASAGAAAAGRRRRSSSRKAPSRSRVAPSLAIHLLSDPHVGDETLRQQLQEIYIEEVVFSRDAETHETPQELAVLHMRLAHTYINRRSEVCGCCACAAAAVAAAAVLAAGPPHPPLAGAAAASEGEKRLEGGGEEEEPVAKVTGAAGAAEEEEDTRRKLLYLLEFRNSLEPQLLLPKVEGTWLVKETALLYSRLGQHEKALALIVNELKDMETARAFCLMADAALQPQIDAMSAAEYSHAVATNSTFRLPLRAIPGAAISGAGHWTPLVSAATASKTGHLGLRERRSIFDEQSPWRQLASGFLSGGAQHTTLQAEFRAESFFSPYEKHTQSAVGELQFSPPSGRSAGILRALLLILLKGLKDSSQSGASSSSLSPRFYEEGIITLLTKYGRHRDLDPALVLRWLPDEWHLRTVSQYLLCSLRSRVHEKLTGAIQEQLCSVAYLHCYDKWAQMRSACYLITAERSCPVCTRRLGSKAFVATPDGNCVHVQCAAAISQLKR